mgnify:CR=1 FL=1
MPLVPDDQRLTQHLLPAFELTPDMAVRQSQKFGGTANGARIANGLQQIHEGIAQRTQTVSCRFTTQGGPLVRQVNVLHSFEFDRLLVASETTQIGLT